jgi:hypothetical protein
MKRLVLVLLFILAVEETSYAAEFKFTPSLGVGEEYNDNVFDSAFDVRTDYITHIMPGLALKYKTPLWDWDINYLLDYRIYARSSYTNDHPQSVDARGLITMVDNLLYLDLSDVYQRVSTNITQNSTQQSLNNNQTQSNIVTASPYITLQPASTVKTKIGGRFANYWYDDPASIDKNEYGGFATVDYEVAPKVFIETGYTYTHGDTRQDPQINNYNWHNVFVGPRYEYAEKSFIYGHGGYTFIDYASGQRFNDPFWDVGISHNFDTYVATIETAVSYDQDPEQNLTQVTRYSGKLEKTLPRGTVSVYLTYLQYKYLNNSTQPETDIYEAGMGAQYELLPRLTANLAFNAQEVHEIGTGNYTYFFVNPNLSYALPKDVTVALNYIFYEYSSPNMAENNRHANRVILEVRKVF